MLGTHFINIDTLINDINTLIDEINHNLGYPNSKASLSSGSTKVASIFNEIQQ